MLLQNLVMTDKKRLAGRTIKIRDRSVIELTTIANYDELAGTDF